MQAKHANIVDDNCPHRPETEALEKVPMLVPCA